MFDIYISKIFLPEQLPSLHFGYAMFVLYEIVILLALVFSAQH